MSVQIRDLLSGQVDADPLPPSESDPLADDHALQESQLLTVEFDVSVRAALVIFDLRTALEIDTGNTGVLVLGGVSGLVWEGFEAETGGRVAWGADGSTISRTARAWTLTLGLWPAPGALFRVASQAATFYIGDVPGIGSVPPNYVQDDAEAIQRGVASLDSTIDIRYRSHVAVRP